MKTAITIAVLALTLSACAHPITVRGHEYRPYGLANERRVKSADVDYELSFGSLVVGVLFWETLLLPIYMAGWDLYQPVVKP